LQAKDIKRQLRILKKQASSLEPNLERRLDDINRWIKDIKPGSLNAKRLVMAFLLQMLRDGNVLLHLKSLPTESQQQEFLDQMTPTQRYWYSDLFPKWLQENDPKFYIWKQKLMSGEFDHQDAAILLALAKDIDALGGTTWHCYIPDLSMATDLIVSYNQERPLCVQLTSRSEKYLQDKYKHWQKTLQSWGINRGLFLSYDPSELNYLTKLVNLVTYNSDHLDQGRYLKFS
jgi:hypothetical protein